ncbi:hypothetical protein JTE90_002399 [Oedothorax gibbosus]|uniref:Cytochrome c oxidase subunit I n=1 Tax=Oedothorax gibbosus TaxID=931172 RepID=A0AAV6THK2_9ARAC|nr:hypothetical protein JTE90_002399 [Oedothorax gibbosus]
MPGLPARFLGPIRADGRNEEISPTALARDDKGYNDPPAVHRRYIVTTFISSKISSSGRFSHVGSTRKPTRQPNPEGATKIFNPGIATWLGVGQGPGTNQREMMTHVTEFPFMADNRNRHSPARKSPTGYPIPVGQGKHTMIPSMWHAVARTSKGITDLLLLLPAVRTKRPPVPLEETPD